MWLIRLAMSRPVTIIVLVMATVILSGLAILRMKVDIFPEIRLPRVTVVQPYGGMDPAQMEGYMVTFYEQHFFYISGVEHVASKTIQGASVMDIYFQPDVDMADAMAQVVAQVERSRAYMPPGTVTPFILRYDVGSVPPALWGRCRTLFIHGCAPSSPPPRAFPHRRPSAATSAQLLSPSIPIS
jgi:multidrug efflux pump subunit AcrB